MEQTKEENGRERYISFLKKKLKLPISWAWNGITPEENTAYREALEEVMLG